jgi:hypothetical protein
MLGEIRHRVVEPVGREEVEGGRGRGREGT